MILRLASPSSSNPGPIQPTHPLAIALVNVITLVLLARWCQLIIIIATLGLILDLYWIYHDPALYENGLTRRCCWIYIYLGASHGYIYANIFLGYRLLVTPPPPWLRLRLRPPLRFRLRR
ncbi:hypothetical protein BJ165DRAFT_1528659 [Panaeolus papilionaceus]|nr:hypothetical protein BJ165DRAFT_1528659 [Panaeolus papilionaceus]